MKKNLLTAGSIGLMLLAAASSGCLQSESDNAPAPAEVDHRAVLKSAMDTQAVNLVNGINKVILDSKFIKNIDSDFGQEKISLDSNNDINKAVDYMLSNQTNQNGAYAYTPDSRLCTELIAKNNPQICVQLMQETQIVQIPADATSGLVTVFVGQHQPFSMVYAANQLQLTADFYELVQTLHRISELEVQAGRSGFAAELPTQIQGSLVVSISNALNVSLISISLPNGASASNNGQRPYSVSVSAKTNAIQVALMYDLGIGNLIVDLPQVALNATIYDNQDQLHPIEIAFPGAMGALTLDNALEKLSLQGLQLMGQQATVKINGQPGAEFSTNSQINLDVFSYATGDLKLKTATAFSAQATIHQNAVMDKDGSLTVSVNAQSEVYFSKAHEQAKMVSGAFNIVGLGDFSGNFATAPGQCFEGDENQGQFLLISQCKF